MRIAFIYDAVYPWEKGGAQKRIWELARRLAEDHDVHYFGMHYWDGSPTMEREGVTFHGVCEPSDLYTDGRRSITQAIRFATHLIPALRGESFDIIDCQEFPYFPIFATKLHSLIDRSTLVVTWYEVWDDYWYDYLGWKRAFGKLVENITVHLPDHVIPISTFIADDVRDIGGSKSISVVENGVDVERIQSIEGRDPTEVVYFGRLSEHKNVDWLLEAIEKASTDLDRPIDTTIIGDGPERDRLEARADELGVSDYVSFEGFIEDDDDVIARIQASKIFVLPSIREGFPNTILEANACGVPSIVVEAPENGSTAVVEDGITGRIVDPKPAAIADAITETLSDDELRKRLSKGAREYGEAHDWGVIVEELEKVYESL
ncbi:MAG: glycosyltransferase family 4 protein [Halobacteriaceae archaeon]